MMHMHLVPKTRFLCDLLCWARTSRTTTGRHCGMSTCKGSKSFVSKCDAVDYGLYLVTDASLTEKAGHQSLEKVVEQAIEGGCSVVQYREKRLPQLMTTRQMLAQAQRLLGICRKQHVAFLIDDRVDLALAVDADGIHIGQSDLHPQTVRKLIGPKKILGVSVATCAEIDEALSHEVRADYIGIGAVFSTQSKLDAQLVGLESLRQLAAYVRQHPNARREAASAAPVAVVAIGGIDAGNISQVLACGADGAAVVKAIGAAPCVRSASQHLRHFINIHQLNGSIEKAEIRERMVQALLDVKKIRPLIHNITNNVVMMQSANALLAIGASPIMTQYHGEMDSIVQAANAVLINIGTLDDNTIKAMNMAARCANSAHKPIVVDPVGYGATSVRHDAILDLLHRHQISILKGNAAELCSMLGASQGATVQKGVDAEGFDARADPALADRTVVELAQRFHCVVCMTGAMDVISDGMRIIHICNNEPALQNLTGMGCITGCIQAALSAACADPLIAAAAGCAFVSISGEMAGRSLWMLGDSTQSIGDFGVQLFNAFAHLSPAVFRKALNFDYSLFKNHA